MSKLNVFILLDRSGSMATKWEETVSSVNAYVKEMTAEGYVTVALFDDQQGTQFDIIRDDVKFKNFTPINAKEFSPRGGTPLYDCVEKIVSLAEKENNDKTVIVVMTDGEENSSKEISRDTAKYILNKCKRRDWQVVFLGADFDAFAQASSVGVGLANTLNMSKGYYESALRGLAAQSCSYAATGASMSFSDTDRSKAVGGFGTTSASLAKSS